LTEG
jgi:large subunit ribosomal protein LP2